ncbi:MAG: IPExxxVDY family protein [Bacteroidales bacterium]|nr:IPExxxVDY family protein [Bacteroidales bacterium]
MTKIKKHRISLEPDRNYYLAAIASHEKVYYMGWILNRELGIHFVRSADFCTTRKSTNLFFPVFAWKDEYKMLSWHLISNRSEHGFFLDDLKNIDFLLHITPNPGAAFIDNLENKLKTIPVIYAFFPVDPQEYPMADSLQFD